MQSRLFSMLLASSNVDLGTVDDCFVWAAQRFLQAGFRLLELVLLQSAKPSLIVLQRLGVAWILSRLFFGGYFQCHQKPSFRIEIEMLSQQCIQKQTQAGRRSLNGSCRLQIHRLPVALDDAFPDLARALALLVHCISVIKFLQARAAHRAVRA